MKFEGKSKSKEWGGGGGSPNFSLNLLHQ